MTEHKELNNPSTPLDTLISGLAQAHNSGDKELEIIQASLSTAIELLANNSEAMKHIALTAKQVIGNDATEPCYEEYAEDLLELNAYCELAPPTSMTLLDTTVYDWHVSENDPAWDAPEAHKDPYRFLIEHCPVSKQVWFRLYPEALDGITHELPEHGLAGVIEVRNGRPAMGVGVNEEILAVHVESAESGLYIHHDDDCSPVATTYDSHDHGMSFPADLYPCGYTGWIYDAQRAIARHALSNYDFDDYVLERSGDWLQSNSAWTVGVEFSHSEINNVLSASFVVDFFEQSTRIASVSLA